MRRPSLDRLLFRFLLPPACIACHAALGPRDLDPEVPRSSLCPECDALLRAFDEAGICHHCGAPRHHEDASKSIRPGRCGDCTDLPDVFVQARSSFSYSSPAGLIVRNLKYQRAAYLADWLVRLSLDDATGDWIRGLPAGTLLVPVPMALWRQLRRNYNQAEEIARSLGSILGLQVADSDCFVRSRRTPPQARRHSRQDRLENMKDAFRVDRPSEIRDRAILLVDDVMTTGATVASAAQTLLTAGAKEIYIYTPVRARFKDDDDSDLAG